MLNNMELFERGLAKLGEIDGAQGDAVMDALADIAPDLGRYIVSFAFGEDLLPPRAGQARTRAADAGAAGGAGRLRKAVESAYPCGFECGHFAGGDCGGVYPLRAVFGLSEGLERSVCGKRSVCGGVIPKHSLWRRGSDME